MGFSRALNQQVLLFSLSLLLVACSDDGGSPSSAKKRRQKLLSVALATDKYSQKTRNFLDCYSKAGEQSPAQALLPHSKLFWYVSISWVWKGRAVHVMCLWGMLVRRHRPARIVAPPFSFPVEPLETCASQTWLLLASECHSVGKWCSHSLDMLSEKVLVLTVFSKKVQVFPAYWNICFDFYHTL